MKTLLILSLITITLTACKKEVPYFPPTPPAPSNTPDGEYTNIYSVSLFGVDTNKLCRGSIYGPSVVASGVKSSYKNNVEVSSQAFSTFDGQKHDCTGLSISVDLMSNDGRTVISSNVIGASNCQLIGDFGQIRFRNKTLRINVRPNGYGWGSSMSFSCDY